MEAKSEEDNTEALEELQCSAKMQKRKRSERAHSQEHDQQMV